MSKRTPSETAMLFVAGALAIGIIVWLIVGVPISLWWVLLLMAAAALGLGRVATRKEDSRNKATDDDFVARLKAEHDGDAGTEPGSAHQK